MLEKFRRDLLLIAKRINGKAELRRSDLLITEYKAANLSQPDLSGNPFFARLKFQFTLKMCCKKRLGTEGGNSCPKY
ncbi:hypothetical protein SAMN05421679_10149 [Epilithonimonas pallida]|uniref:Uncharacterized protein n=1 Tax=Epilithonimonas pallida TaxID=373671 RepID=A0ABY1QWW3_9FLAO|nr:hypothetical protein SAMN05421679_10149 [Epilithonimonas pallida]